jgi:Trk-type K+ transport system membrane component
VSTRTAGFAVTNLQLLHPAVLVSYLVMMYISVFPVAISIRRTNVYEEKSLGIWVDDDEEEDQQQSNPSFVGMHLSSSEGDIGANGG